MFLKDSILSHFFNSDPKEVEEEIRPEKRESKAIPPQEEPSCLQLETDHPINQLWRMRTEESGRMPAPRLHLTGPPGRGNVLNPEETKRELSRLLFAVSSTAKKRLAASKEKDMLSSGMDAEVVVFMTSNNLTAWILVYPPIGKGKEVEQEMLAQALREKGVEFGVDEAAVDAIPQNPERYFHMHLVAQGKVPVHGEDGYVVDLFSRSVKKTAKVSESGKVDYTELNLIQNVNEGDIICRIVHPMPGQPGISVSGQTIPSREGKSVTVPQGRNTALSEDGNSLIATSAGRVEFSGRSFQVKPVLEIDGNVDYSTGNINFLGDVEIRGDICSGFNVKASGNITVGGVVEACKLEAGGNLIIEKGVKGDNQAIIQAHRSIYVKYLESCNICVRESLQSDCIINCNVYSDSSVQVDSGRGIIIGGKIRAATTVKAKIVGSKAECHTVVELGGMPSVEFEYECLRQEINQLESILEILEPQPDSPAKLKGIPMVRMKLSVNKNKLNQYKEAVENLKLQDHTVSHEGQQLQCGIAYPGTEVIIGGAAMRINSEAKNCTVVLADREVRMI